MLTMNKKTALITLLIIILVGVIGASAYLLKGSREQEKTEQPEEPTTTEPIDASNWKVYRNEKYGFEFKYPKEYDEVEECKLKETENGIELGEGRFEIEVEVLKHEYPLAMYVNKFIAEEMQKLGMIEMSLDELAERNLWIEAEKVFIGPNEGFRVDLPGRPSSVFFLSKGNKFYKIRWGARGVLSCIGYARLKGYDEIDIFEQIPYTFRLY